MKRYLACLAAGLFSFYNLFQFSLFNVLAEHLAHEFHLNGPQFGLFSSVYLLANTLSLIPMGILLDRYSLRRVVLIFVSLDVMACFVIAYSHSLTLDVLMRILQGVASTLSLLTSTRLAIRWFPEKAATAVGVLIALALSGGIFANTLFAKWVTSYQWREALVIGGIIGVLFLSVMALFLFDNKPLKQKLVFNIYSVGISCTNVAYGFYIGVMSLPIFVLGSLWGAIYLTQTYAITSLQASSLCGFIFLGLIVGSPLSGFIADFFQNKKHVMQIGAVLLLITAIVFSLAIPITMKLLGLLLFLLGFFSGTHVVAFSVIAEKNSALHISAAISVATFVANLTGAISQPLFGFFIKL